MTISDLVQSARFVVDAEGRRQAVLLDLETWEEVVARLRAQEDEWRRPFEAVRAAWQTSEPTPDEEAGLPPDDELAALVHQARSERHAGGRD